MFCIKFVVKNAIRNQIKSEKKEEDQKAVGLEIFKQFFNSEIVVSNQRLVMIKQFRDNDIVSKSGATLKY
jgi:hypothetical protein